MRGTAEAPELFDAGGRRVEFTLIVPQESGPRVSTAAAVQQDLAKVGMLVNVAPIETGELRRRTLQSYDYEAALFGLGITDFDPSSASGLLASGSTDHQWHPAQAAPATPWETRLDALVAQLASERDIERRRAVFRDIQLLMAEQMPVIPLVARHITCASGTRVGNYRPSTVIPYSLWNAEELFVKQ
jgi:peptide/nickel transport system substrate-binding protein